MGNRHASLARWRDGLAVELLALVPGLLFLMGFVWRAGFDTPSGRQFTLFDDAMISMTYARTLAETGEWVWFPGADRVQGITNPLWTLYMTLLHVVGLEGSSAALAVSLTGIVLLLGSALIVSRLVRRGLAGWQSALGASAIAGGLVPFLYPVSYWTLRGMEVGLLALLAILMVLGVSAAVTRWQDGSSAAVILALCGVVGVLGIATRLDFAVIAGALSAWMLLWAPGKRSRIDVLFFMLLPPVIFGVIVLAFQQAYWGDWLTNTYRLKMEGFSLLERITRGVVTTGKALPVLVLTICGLVATLKWSFQAATKHLAVSLATVAFVVTAYSVWVGGDAWEDYRIINRYIAVSLPACVAVAMIGVGHFLRNAIPNVTRTTVVPLTILVVSGLGLGAMANPFGFSTKQAGLIVLGLASVVAVTVLACRAHTRFSSAKGPAVTVLAAAALAMILSTSLIPGTVQLLEIAQAPGEVDARMTRLGRNLNRVTEPGAQIAVLWAGSPSYYSERAMIDLLGKSDRRIATGLPSQVQTLESNSTFYPGHNKWDFEYSIGELEPDVVADFWGVEEAVQQLVAWGYTKRCLADGTSFYVRSDSNQIRWTELSLCP
jgi:arabinofuranosyltransferase